MHCPAIKTLSPAFFIWQSLSMSQFTLKRKTFTPKLHNNHNILAASSLIIQLIVLIHGFYDPKLYIDESLNFVLIVLSVATVALYRSSSILFIIESRLNRENEIRFLSLIAKSDEILTHKLHVDIKYVDQKQKNFRQLIVRILVVLIVNAVFIFDWLVIKVPTQSTIWSCFVAFPILICSMRYHQIISYVNLVLLNNVVDER